MDTTVRESNGRREHSSNNIGIITIDVGDGIQFVFEKMEPIREDDAYNNFRVHIRAFMGK